MTPQEALQFLTQIQDRDAIDGRYNVQIKYREALVVLSKAIQPPPPKLAPEESPAGDG